MKLYSVHSVDFCRRCRANATSVDYQDLHENVQTPIAEDGSRDRQEPMLFFEPCLVYLRARARITKKAVRI